MKHQNDIPRVFGMLGYLRKPRTVNELAAFTGTSTKTVRRDLAFLRSLGFRVDEQVGRWGRKTYRARGTMRTLKQLLGD